MIWKNEWSFSSNALQGCLRCSDCALYCFDYRGSHLQANDSLKELVSDDTIQRILVQVDIVESNSMIEAWWRQLKHQWLYLNELDSASSVRKLIDFYVEQHNSVVPLFAFQGQTPDEMVFGTGVRVPANLNEKRATHSMAVCRTVHSSPFNFLNSTL